MLKKSASGVLTRPDTFSTVCWKKHLAIASQCIQLTKQTQRMKRLQLRVGHREERSVVEAKIKARESCGEGYNEDRMCIGFTQTDIPQSCSW